MYEYPLITGANPSNYDSLMISHHPYGDNTPESIKGTVVEGREVPGVGSPLHPDADQLAAYTRQAIDNTFKSARVTDDGKNPLPPLPGR
jgi:hypothetical protein